MSRRTLIPLLIALLVAWPVLGQQPRRTIVPSYTNCSALITSPTTGDLCLDSDAELKIYADTDGDGTLSWEGVGTANAPGSDGDLLYNESGTITQIADSDWNGTSLTVPNLISTGNIRGDLEGDGTSWTVDANRDSTADLTVTSSTVTATSFTGALTGNASTATALAANPGDCAANTFATTIAATGTLTCASITDADVPNSITIDAATSATRIDDSTGRVFLGTCGASECMVYDIDDDGTVDTTDWCALDGGPDTNCDGTADTANATQTAFFTTLTAPSTGSAANVPFNYAASSVNTDFITGQAFTLNGLECWNNAVWDADQDGDSTFVGTFTASVYNTTDTAGTDLTLTFDSNDTSSFTMLSDYVCSFNCSVDAGDRIIIRYTTTSDFGNTGSAEWACHLLYRRN